MLIVVFALALPFTMQDTPERDVRATERSILALANLGIAMASSPSAGESHALRPVTLHVLNTADIPEQDMSRARREVVRLYSSIGITLTWEEYDAKSQIQYPPENETMLLRVTILRDAPRRLWRSQALGSAPLLPGESRVASVYYSRVKQAALRHARELNLVLGHAIAHEAAHLIIPQYGHSSEGLMKAVWSARDYQIAVQGRLRFLDEAALIRAALVQ